MAKEMYKKIGARVREARDFAGHSQAELGDVIGYKQAGVSKLERGERAITLPVLKEIADFLGRPLSYFIDDLEGMKLDPKFSDVMANLDFTIVPIYASVNAGEPAFVMEDPEYITFPREFLKQATFGVKVVGDSMIGVGINDGDILLIRRQDDADHGDIVVARVNGDEYTIKRLRKQGGDIALEPANPAYEAIVSKDLRIVGKVVGLHRRF